MMKNIALSRPATSAIAAFLALSTTAALAQEAPTITMTPPVAAPTAQAPTPQTPLTVAQPGVTAPVAAPQTATPAPKPVIRVPLEITPAEIAPSRTTERGAAAPAPTRPERTAPRARPVAAAVPTAAATPTVAASTADAAPASDMTPVAAPMAAAIEPIAATTPLPAETATATSNDFPWEIAGGAAALLLVGGVGLAFARRRRTTDEIVYDEVVHDAPVQRFEPIAASAPVASEAQSWVSPAYAPHESTPMAPRTTPAFAAAPSGSMGRHEAMAMTGPTPENPFATLSKRLKRARFLDRHERIAYDETLSAQKDMTRKPVSAWEIAQRPAAAVQEQEVRRPEPARVRTTTTYRPGYSSN